MINSTWLLYDAECPFCTAGVKMFEPSLKKRDCKIRPLQNKTVMKLLDIKKGDYLPEMKVIGKERKVYGGARAVAYLSRRIWWAKPIWALSYFPPFMRMMDYIYEQIAKRRHCGGICEV